MATTTAQAQWTTVGSDIHSTNTGNVGIGIDTPSSSFFAGGKILQIYSTSNLPALRLQAATGGILELGTDSSGVYIYGASNHAMGIFTNGVRRMTLDTAGHVGIGTTSPTMTLTVNGTTLLGTGVWPTAGLDPMASRVGVFSSTENGVLTVGNMQTGIGTDRGGVLLLGARNTTGVNDFAYSKIVGGRTDAVEGNFKTFLAFSTSNAERMRIDQDGNVSMTGNLTVTGNITGATVVGAVYQDIAEWVPTGESLAPGTVVVIAGSQVTPSTKAYDTKVAGVVSAQPGVILGREGDAKSKVATLGRVRVRVDATARPVQVGDLLVTSDKFGTAMVSEAVDVGGVKIHRPGTLIGKALEPLDGGVGEVLVLLSLQ